MNKNNNLGHPVSNYVKNTQNLTSFRMQISEIYNEMMNVTKKKKEKKQQPNTLNSFPSILFNSSTISSYFLLATKHLTSEME